MRGFVTVATGDERYYRIAANLVKSYRLKTKKRFPFALICDRKNSYTEMFDKVIILKHPNFSYLDKIEMLNNPPFDENIFIDSDCLCYGDINQYWNNFPEFGVSCFGKTLPLSSKEGWFEPDGIGKYAKMINFLISMHGGIIFFNNDQITQKIYKLSLDIIENYQQYSFKIFNKPADEPVLALSMAIYNCKPVEDDIQDGGNNFLFYPMAQKVYQDIVRGIVTYTNDGKLWHHNVPLIHWSNINTDSTVYKIAADYLNYSNPIVHRIRSFKIRLIDKIQSMRG